MARAPPVRASCCESARAVRSASKSSLRSSAAVAAGGLGLASQRLQIHRRDATVLHDHAAANHHVAHRRAVLGMNELVGGVVERHPVRMSQIEEHDVGLVAGGEPPQTPIEAESPVMAAARPGG